MLSKQINKLYKDKAFVELSQSFLEIIKKINFHASDLFFLKSFSNLFINIFIKKEYIIPQENKKEFIILNSIISNILYLANFKNLDRILFKLNKELKETKNENVLIKILTLYSIKSNLKLDFNFFFEINANLSTYWYFCRFKSISFNINQKSFKNFKYHLEKVNEVGNLFTHYNFSLDIYYQSPYIDIKLSKKYREKINSLIQKKTKYLKVINNHNKKHIAIISDKLTTINSVYRCQYKIIKKLSEKYQLSLINISKSDVSKEIIKFFTNVYSFDYINLEKNKFLMNDFSLVYHTDTSTTFQSMILSNIRLAKHQLTSYGNPISTYGSEIDYFIVNDEIENEKVDYSEKLIKINNFVLDSINISLKKTNLEKKTNNSFKIICPWNHAKLNYDIIKCLKKVKNNANCFVKFIFFSIMGKESLHYQTLYKEIEFYLGNNFELINYCQYNDFLNILNNSEIILNTSFGGHTIAYDSLLLKKIFLTIEGKYSFQKFDSYILKKLSLDDLIAKSEEDFTDKLLNLINNQDYYKKILKKVNNADIKSIYPKENVNNFVKLIDQILE